MNKTERVQSKYNAWSRHMLLALFVLGLVIFRITIEVALWENHRWQILGAVTLITIEALLIIGLLVERRRRQISTEGLEKSEKRHGAFLRALPDMIFVLDMSGRFVDFHAKDHRDLIVPPEEFLGKKYSDVLPPEIVDQLSECFSLVKLTDDVPSIEFEVSLNGIERHFEARLTRCNERQILTIVRDVTERRRAEQDLKERDQLLGAIMNSLSSHVAVLDREGVITYTSRSWREFSKENDGIPERVAVGANYLKVCADAIGDVTAFDALRGIEDVLSRRLPTFAITYACHSPKVDRWFMMKVDPMLPSHGGAVISHIDITDRRKAEEALRASEERFEKAFLASPNALVLGRVADGKILDVNESWTRLVGYGRDDVTGVCGLDSTIFLDPDDGNRLVGGLKSGKGVRNLEMTLRSKTGEIRNVLASSEPLTVTGELCFLKMFQDVTEVRRTEKAVRQVSEFNRQIVESTMDCVKILDLDGRLLHMNKNGQEALEIIDINRYRLGRWADLWPQETRPIAERAIQRARNGNIGAFRAQGATEKGKLKWWDNLITPIRGANGDVERLLGVSRDITEVTVAAQAIIESEERFASVFRSNPQAMSLVNLDDGQILDVNDSYLSLSGYTREEVIGRNSLEIGIWETRQYRDRFHECFETGKTVHNVEVEFVANNGDRHVMLVSAEILELGGHKCILSAANDITERKNLEVKLRQSEREFATLVQNSPDLIARLDKNLRYIYVSPSVERIIGLPGAQFIGKTPTEVVLRGYEASNLESAGRNAMRTGKAIGLDTTFRNRSYWTRVIPERSPEDCIESLMIISQDVTERIRTERELKELTKRLFTLQEEERRRIARELHDETAQGVFAITLNLAKIRHSSTVDTSEMNFLIDECQMLGEQSLKEIRTLSYLLHPPMLDQAGLVSALQWYVDGFNKRSGLRVNVHAQAVGRLPSDIETALFRVVQESLTNVRRHSGSDTASIRLERKLEEVVLEIRDDGPSHTRPSTRSEESELGVGIPGMRERMRQLGGRLDVTSTETGTIVAAVVPLNGHLKRESFNFAI